MGGALITAIRRNQQAIIFAAAGGILIGCALPPLAMLLVELLASGIASLDVLAAPQTWALLAASIFLAAAITAITLVIGVPLGVLIGRTDLRGARTLWAVHAFPMFLPPFLLALGWFHLFGASGLIGGPLTSALLFTELGLISILVVAFTPIVTSLVALGVMGIDASLEEAARLVAGPRRVAMRILLPAAYPAVALAAIIVFALSVSEIGVPMFLRVKVFQAAVFTRLGGIDYAPGEAFALVSPLVPLALFLLYLERRYVGARSFTVLGLRGPSREPLGLGRWRNALTFTCWCIAALSVAPIVSLAIRATGRPGFTDLPQWAGQAPANSVVTSLLAAAVIAVLGLVLGHAAARRWRGATWFDSLAMLTFLTPASVLGVGLIATWNRTALQAVYGSIAILAIGFVARYAVVGLRTVATVVAQSPVSLEHAAAATGARFTRRLLRIVLPINVRGVIAAWLLALVFSLRDLETPVLFYPAGREPLTVRIFTLEANGPESVIAALAVTQVLMTALALSAGAVLLLRGRRT